MHPVIFKFGFIQIYSYGLMVALAFWVCTFLLSRLAAAEGLSRDFFWNMSFWILLAGILGGRLAYILLNPGFFRENPAEIFALWQGGLVWYGAFLGGALAAVAYIGLQKAPVFKILDLAAPFVALGQSLGRVGCLLNGCCYGRPAPWGLYFPAHNEYLIPAQMISSMGALVIFVALRFFSVRPHRPGSVFAAYLLISSLERFLMEFLRGDSQRSFWGMTVFQVISIAIFLSAVCLWFMISLPHRKTQGSG